MILRELRIANLRNIEAQRLEPQAGINLLTGANGAGKTSVLEAICLLSHGRSFRTRRNEALRRSGSDSTSVFGIVEGPAGTSRLGLDLAGERWRGRVDGRDTVSLAELLIHCAVTCFEPGSHALISGPGELRRRFVDWGVFHVEPDFPAAAHRYRRALRQRNAALRSGVSEAALEPWDLELVAAAARLGDMRSAYLARFQPVVQRLADDYLPELGGSLFRSRSGWPAHLAPFAALNETRAADRQRGHTTRGPHRADWSLVFAKTPHREQLSRGQEKLCAIACLVAQARLYFEDHKDWPIVVLDDLASELDRDHQVLALNSLRDVDQIFISGTDMPAALLACETGISRFHVEQGRSRRLL